MKTYPISPLNKVIRGAKKAAYDAKKVHEVLDANFLCHIGYTFEGQTIVIPTAYGRIGDKLYIHGSRKSRMLVQLLRQGTANITVTNLDGLVMARSAFHHSANYRSVVVFGTVTEIVTHKEKNKSLQALIDHMVPGHWDTIRQPSEKELKATLVLELTIDTASAKIRTGDPIDDAEDYELPIWAGVIPMRIVADTAISDSKLMEGIPVPASVHQFIKSNT